MSCKRSFRSQFGGAYEQYLILILFIVLLCTTAMASIAFSTNQMLCGTVHSFGSSDTDPDPQEYRKRYVADPTGGTHCWKTTITSIPNPALYYF